MNKEEIISRVSNDTGYSLGMVGNVIESFLENITEGMMNGGRVQLYGFGTFEGKHMKARVGRNPRPNEQLEIPERVVPSFKPGNRLKKSVTRVNCGYITRGSIRE